MKKTIKLTLLVIWNLICFYMLINSITESIFFANNGYLLARPDAYVLWEPTTFWFNQAFLISFYATVLGFSIWFTIKQFGKRK